MVGGSLFVESTNFIGWNINILNTETFLDGTKEVGLEVNAARTKFVFMFRHHQSAGLHIAVLWRSLILGKSS
jgi:hypothetical protein